jgi:hypothetical protein
MFNKKEVSAIKPLFTEKLSSDDVKDIREQIAKNSNAFTFNSTNIQVGISGNKDSFQANYEDFQSFLKEVGYEGGPISELSKEQASELVSEDGMFGIKQTSERIANFVINGANGDESLLRAGREGMLTGFKQAEEMWGGKLPEISQETMKAATQMVDKAMTDLGFSIIDKNA